jgi:amino acid transporter
VQLTLPELWSGFAFSDEFARNAVILGLGLLAIVTVINLVGVRVMGIVNNIGVGAEIMGAVLLIILLVFHITRGPGALFETNGTGDGRDWGYLGAFLVCGFFSLYNMYAFDTASTLAEETDNPRRNAPRAVVRALLMAGILGFAIIVLSIMVIPDLGAEGLSTSGLPFVVQEVLGSTVGQIVLVDVTIAITVCALALQAWAARTLFAMGRDDELPGGRVLARVSKETGVPVIATLSTAVIGALVLLVNLNNPKAFNVVIALGIIFIYLAYLGVTIPALRRRREGWLEEGAREGLFTIPGRFGTVANVIAIVYGFAMLLNLMWPRAEFYGEAWYQRYAALIFVPLAVAIGSVYYFTVKAREPQQPPAATPASAPAEA